MKNSTREVKKNVAAHRKAYRYGAGAVTVAATFWCVASVVCAVAVGAVGAAGGYATDRWGNHKDPFTTGGFIRTGVEGAVLAAMVPFGKEKMKALGGGAKHCGSLKPYPRRPSGKPSHKRISP